MEGKELGIICAVDGKVPGHRKEGVFIVKAYMEPLKTLAFM